jgi:hypothetical protein
MKWERGPGRGETSVAEFTPPTGVGIAISVLLPGLWSKFLG